MQSRPLGEITGAQPMLPTGCDHNAPPGCCHAKKAIRGQEILLLGIPQAAALPVSIRHPSDCARDAAGWLRFQT